VQLAAVARHLRLALARLPILSFAVPSVILFFTFIYFSRHHESGDMPLNFTVADS
jgi:hypothetical protein